ncbi:MAG TPA: hypothetical protein VF009_06980 [Solirubrobacterales bacterium]
MNRSEVYRFRLSPEEQDRLQREADERGLESKADRIREALGWTPTVRPVSEATKAVIRPPSDGPAADPATEPGNAAIEELAKRIHGGEGQTMRVAARQAEERLGKA